MSYSLHSLRRRAGQALIGAAVATVLATSSCSNSDKRSTAASVASDPTASQTVKLTDSQLASIRVGPVLERDFPVQKEAVGSIDFNENRTVQVFTPYPGRVLRTLVDLGDEVREGQVLFTIESADFIQAESALIAAAGVLDQTTSALSRAKQLYAVKGIDQNDFEAVVASQQSAEGALRAARNAVAIFGKSNADIDRIVQTREVETALVVKSPITGRVTARNAAPGMLEQPGLAPAPYAVADLSRMWLLATVPESDSPVFKVGQELSVSVPALPGRMLKGTIVAIGAAVDPVTRRVTIRSEVQDPQHQLRSGMFADFIIRTGAPIRSPAVPLNAVVREGDGTMSVWLVGSDRGQFVRRAVRVGLQSDGYNQIVEGLRAGDTVAVDGAILLSNMLFGGAS